jgi:hypothetical protein
VLVVARWRSAGERRDRQSELAHVSRVLRSEARAPNLPTERIHEIQARLFGSTERRTTTCATFWRNGNAEPRLVRVTLACPAAVRQIAGQCDHASIAILRLIF